VEGQLIVQSDEYAFLVDIEPWYWLKACVGSSGVTEVAGEVTGVANVNGEDSFDNVDGEDSFDSALRSCCLVRESSMKVRSWS
jgi:hypothetical protein